MTNIYLLCGLPASGKSTWAKKRMESLGDDCCIISRDKIRFSMLKEGEQYFEREDAVFTQFVKEINDSIKANIKHIIIDATHINARSRKKLLTRIEFSKECALTVVVFSPPFEVCLERNRRREARERVPDPTMRSMRRILETPTLEELAYLTDTIPVDIEES